MFLITTSEITGLGAVNLLEAIRAVGPSVRFYQASTSEVFGTAQAVPQTEITPFYPRSPHGVTKLSAHWITVNYRESYDMPPSGGILFNRESPLRGKEFVTRKITDSRAKIALGKLEVLELGNLDAKRDWGYAKEYVEGIWLMLQADKSETYVLATNRTLSVRNFLALAFKTVNIEIDWKRNKSKGRGVDIGSGKTLVKTNPKSYRPAEVDVLIGHPSSVREELGWKAQTALEDLCHMIVGSDISRICSGQSTTLLSVLTILEELAGYEMPITKDPELIRDSDNLELYGSTKQRLNFANMDCKTL